MYYLFADEPEVWPNVVPLVKDLALAPRAGTVLDAPRATIMNVGIRVRTTGTLNAVLEEFDGADWIARDRTECLGGDTLWHHQLRHPEFRLRLENPSPDGEVTVSIDLNMPQRPEP
ncbi:MAG: hypothetical protein QMC81_03510 [Thermoanaerobacterales bacterium]|nr:hypothetical protein [Bacillota bacterium]MDI6906547.1 hypothetical protein [Thermoanaerobacterales bacterium]